MDGKKVSAYRWWEQDGRFDLANPNNDSNRFGFVVEIDPFSPDSIPVKRTALGRIKHENATYRGLRYAMRPHAALPTI